MALQNFVDKAGPVIGAAWLNAVDVLKETIFGAAATKADARAALTSDAPMSLGQGGTGATTAGAARTALGSTAIGDSLFTAASSAAALSAIGAAADSTVVHVTGNESVAGIKTFSSSPILPTPAVGDNSTKGATTAFVTSANAATASLSKIFAHINFR